MYNKIDIIIFMKEITPKYYNKFKCIADRCRHSCCIGWEIDIDADTLLRYKRIGGTLGKRLDSCICYDDTPHFILTEDERCPFLDGSGLCDIIKEQGKSALCQICADHPRFRNFFSGHTEVGLGLCCEAATELILSQTDRFFIEVPQTKDKQEMLFFKLRQTVFDIMQDREFSFDERAYNLLCFFNTEMPKKSIAEWRYEFLALEIMDSAWTDMLNTACDDVSKQDELIYEQLICSSVFRHLTGAIDDGEYALRLKMCILFCDIIASVANTGHNINEVCRLFSAEIEYSDTNIDRILKALI